MSTTIVMPKMGYDMTEGKIVRWLKREGDRVQKGEPIAEIETDKVNIQIEAFASGQLQKIVAPEGQSVPVGQPIAMLGEPGEKPATAPPAEAMPPQQEGAGEGAEAPAAVVEGVASRTGAAPEVHPEPLEERVKVSPVARRLAEEQGVELERVQGTGPGGRITKEDVERFMGEAVRRREAPARAGGAPPATTRPSVAPQPAAAPSEQREAPKPPAPEQPVAARQTATTEAKGPEAAAPEREKAAEPAAAVRPGAARPPAAPPSEEAPAEAMAGAGPAETIELSRIGQTVARRMADSKRTAPHFYATIEIDMSRAVALREELNATLEEDGKVSYNDFVIKATAMALTRFPRMNGSYADGKLTIYKEFNLAMAVALEEGLIAPVIRQCDRKRLPEIAVETRRLAAHAKEGKLRQEEYEGGTFTVTNLGMLGVEEFAAIINPPQTAILAVGAILERPIVRDGAFAAAHLMKVTLSVDHRAVNGADAARFLAELKRLLENPVSLLL